MNSSPNRAKDSKVNSTSVSLVELVISVVKNLRSDGVRPYFSL